MIKCMDKDIDTLKGSLFEFNASLIRRSPFGIKGDCDVRWELWRIFILDFSNSVSVLGLGRIQRLFT